VCLNGRRSKFLVRETRTRYTKKIVRVSYVLVRVFSRTRNLGELEQWSHVIEMLRCYSLEVSFVFPFVFTIFCCWSLLIVSSFFVFLPFCWLQSGLLEKNRNLKFFLASVIRYVSRTRNLDGSVCDLYTNFLYQDSRTSFSYKKLGPSAMSFKVTF